MLKNLSQSAWFVGLLIAVVLGAMLGMAISQNALNTGIALAFGWLFFPFSLASPPHVDMVTHVPLWLMWLIALYYPLAMVMAGICTYWALYRAWKKRHALLLVVLLACATLLVSIPVSLIAPSLNSNGISFGVTISLLLPVLANLLVSAVLGWAVGCLIPRRKPAIAS